MNVSVPVLTLDKWAALHSIDPRDVRFVKVDTQGYEPHILAGAKSLLSVPNMTWQLEVHPALMAKGGTSLAQFHETLIANFKAYINLRDFSAGLQPIETVGQVLDKLANGHTDILAITKG